MIVYKLFRLRKDGTLGPLFINARLRVPIGKWMEAEDHPTKGFAHRPGWHAGLTPNAPHLGEKGRVWAECEVDDFTYHRRPAGQGGVWILADRLRVNRVLSEEDVLKVRNWGTWNSSEEAEELASKGEN